jgi:peptide/nickel transport system substrate-binding protein
MRITRRAVVAAGIVVALTIAACGPGSGDDAKTQFSPGFAECDAKPNTCNSGATRKGGTLILGIEKKLPNWNIFDSDGGTFETAQVMTGLLPVTFIIDPDSSVRWNTDLFSEEPKATNTNPLTVVFKLRKEAVWDDGTPISARDFEYFWRSNNGKDCPDCTPAATAGYDVISAVTGSDDDKTVTVTFGELYPDWRSLFGSLYPAHIAAKAGDLKTPAGLKAAFDAFRSDVPTWTGGPYKISEQVKDVSVTLVPNEKWYGDPKPSLDKVIFRIIEDQAQQTPALQNKEVTALMSQPNADMVAKVQGMPGVNFNLSKGTNWEHVDLNLTNKWLRDMPLRQAIFTAIDRKSIIDKTIGTFFKGAAPLNSHNFMPGTKSYQDVIGPTGQGTGDLDKARKILTDAGYRIDGGKLITKDGQTVPPLRFRYTTGNQLRQQTGELIQAQMKQIGIELKLEPTAALGTTLDTGDFDMIVFAWVTGPFLSDKKDLWTTDGGGNYGSYSSADVDRLINEAVKTLDENKARELFNQADEIMAREAYNLPLFQKPVFIAVYADFVNVRNNPTVSGPVYNIEEWGQKQ